MDIIEELKKINASQQAQIEELIRQNQILTEQVKYLRNKLYGHSSEKSIDDGQTSLFDDASNGVFEDPESTGEQIEIVTVRKKKRQSQKAKITKNLPIKEELIELAYSSDYLGYYYLVRFLLVSFFSIILRSSRSNCAFDKWPSSRPKNINLFHQGLLI
ncbi:IS66 family transposase [Lactiplantibacillus plantarum]|uniref:IS66 family transposase n=1 Tax=Lactiplantibacillus plantarum TaxID=1590 RepID=UPI00280BDE69|nr:hypothetical protein [Lactiplantibacillus plantarum]